jgi:hypothetical protein
MSLLRSISVATFFALLGFAGAASADVCVFDNDNLVGYKFAKLKLPKRVGVAVPVTGVSRQVGVTVPLPLQGVISRVNETTWLLGFVRYGNTCMVTGTLDAALDGAFGYDCNLDGASDAAEPSAIEAIDCDSL